MGQEFGDSSAGWLLLEGVSDAVGIRCHLKAWLDSQGGPCLCLAVDAGSWLEAQLGLSSRVLTSDLPSRWSQALWPPPGVQLPPLWASRDDQVDTSWPFLSEPWSPIVAPLSYAIGPSILRSPKFKRRGHSLHLSMAVVPKNFEPHLKTATLMVEM